MPINSNGMWQAPIMGSAPSPLDPRLVRARQMQRPTPLAHPMQAAHNKYAQDLRAAGPDMPDTTGGKIAKFLGSALLPAAVGGLAGGSLGDAAIYGLGSASDTYSRHKALTKDIDQQIASSQLGLPMLKREYDIGGLQMQGQQLENELARWKLGHPDALRRSFDTRSSPEKIFDFAVKRGFITKDMTPEQQMEALERVRFNQYNRYAQGADVEEEVSRAGARGAEAGKQEAAIAATPERVATEIESKAQAEAARDLPQIEANAQTMIGLLDELESHPGLPGAVGLKGPGNIIPGSPESGFRALYDQVTGKLFLEAYQQLKGGGQITEVEGKKAEAAMSRIKDRNQPEAEFRAAIQDLKEVVQSAVERERQKVSGPSSGVPDASGVTVEWED